MTNIKDPCCSDNIYFIQYETSFNYVYKFQYFMTVLKSLNFLK